MKSRSLTKSTEVDKDVDTVYRQLKTEYKEVPFIRTAGDAHRFKPEIAKFLIPDERAFPRDKEMLASLADPYTPVKENDQHVAQFQQAASEIKAMMNGEYVEPPKEVLKEIPKETPKIEVKKAPKPLPKPSTPIISYDKKEKTLPTPPKVQMGPNSQIRSMSSYKSLDLADYLGIIEKAKSLGVSKLKLSGFEVEFFPPEEMGLSTADHAASPNSQSSGLLEGGQIKPAVDKDLLDDMRRTQLMIDDPLAYEQEVISAHIAEAMS